MNNSNLVDYIKLKKIQEYNNIKASLSNITSSCFFRNYNLDINEFEDITKKRNIEIFKELNEGESKLLEELLKYTKHEEYDKYFIQSAILESKKKVLNYMYWQYKLIDTSVKIDLSDLKRVLQIKNLVKYIKPIEISTRCNICGTIATIFVKSYNKKEDISFKCNKCEHEEVRYKENIFPIKCECERCKKMNEEFFFNIKNNFVGLIDGIKQQVEEFYNNSNDVYLIDDEEMEIDYIVNRCEFDKDVREIMSYNPKNIKDLIKIIEKLEQRNKVYNKNYKNYIYDKLLSLKVIYIIETKEDLEIVKEDVIKRFIHINCKYKNENPIESIQKFLSECKNVEHFKSVVKYYYSDRISFKIKNSGFEFFMDNNINCCSWYNPVFKQIMIINKFYFKNNT
ncbi:hypothetical protein FDA31_17480, partial [Clostridium botulinum]|nr:hypothetical protein [Clostridium botulinum]